MFAAIRLTKYPDPDKYFYSGYAIGFDACGCFSLSSGDGFGRNVIIFSVDDSSSVNADNRKKDILIATDGLDNTTITAEAEYSINYIFFLLESIPYWTQQFFVS